MVSKTDYFDEKVTFLYATPFSNYYILYYKDKIIKNVRNIDLHAKNSEYDQEIPQSQTADNPLAPRGRAAQPDFILQ